MSLDPREVRKVAAFTEKLTDLFNDFGFIISGSSPPLRVVQYTGGDDFKNLPFVINYNAVTERYEMDVDR